MDEAQTQGTTPPPQPSGGSASPANQKTSFFRRTPVIVIGSLALGGLFFLGLGYLANSLTHESTDNAFLDGDIVSIGPKVAGNVMAVHVVDNQPVKAGDPLVDLDPRDYKVQLSEKAAAKATAEANAKLVTATFEMLRTQVGTAQANAAQAQAESAADKATADRANEDLKRAEDLFHKNITSSQEYDAAKAAAAAADATYQASLQKVASDESKIAGAKSELDAGYQALERAHAQTHESEVDVEQAQLNLSYVNIVAPQDGWVTRKSVAVGDYISVGQRVMSIVLTDLWVTANFKETQLRRIRVGQRVEMTVDSVAGRKYSGRVQSIQAGSGARFSLLPPENAVGNYVKVVQRVPVKIVFDELAAADHVLGPGMSVAPSIKVTDYDIPESVVVLAALVLACAAGVFWRKMAGQTHG